MDTMKKVLIIDDEERILELMNRFITRLGYEAVTTASWEEGIELFKNDFFALVILDVNMPGRDGFHVARDMNALRPGQKIIIITGLGPGQAYEYLSKLEDVDISEILYKPFDFKKLKQIITRTLCD